MNNNLNFLLLINAPIERDLFVAGGNVNINSDVGGKIVAAGGSVNIVGNVAVFIIGFVILYLLFSIPFARPIIGIT